MTTENPGNGLLTQAPLPAGTFECAVPLGSENGRPVYGPDTPESIPGNAQYVFLLRIPPGESRSLDIVWPHRETPPRPGFDYPHHIDFNWEGGAASDTPNAGSCLSLHREVSQ